MERYRIVTVEGILEDFIDNPYWWKKEELEQFKKDCIRLNFGSMTIDW